MGSLNAFHPRERGEHLDCADFFCSNFRFTPASAENMTSNKPFGSRAVSPPRARRTFLGDRLQDYAFGFTPASAENMLTELRLC